MACYRPIRAYQCSDGSVVFQERQRHDTVRSLDLACGQCIGCRVERSRQWAVRILHEASLHDESAFVTLTYAPEFLPERGQLVHRDWQLFMKKLLRRIGKPVRFFMCGEYGEEHGRPHYHACLFGLWFDDAVFYSKSKDHTLFTSKLLTDVWGKGLATFGRVSFESAQYVAGYVTKKVTGEKAEEHYRRVDLDTGEVYQLKPEYCQMSRRSGVGVDWLRLYWPEVAAAGEVVINGQKAVAPRFYIRRLRKLAQMDDIDLAKETAARRSAADRSDERLAVREHVARARAQFNRRNKVES